MLLILARALTKTIKTQNQFVMTCHACTRTESKKTNRSKFFNDWQAQAKRASFTESSSFVSSSKRRSRWILILHSQFLVANNVQGKKRCRNSAKSFEQSLLESRMANDFNPSFETTAFQTFRWKYHFAISSPSEVRPTLYESKTSSMNGSRVKVFPRRMRDNSVGQEFAGSRGWHALLQGVCEASET